MAVSICPSLRGAGISGAEVAVGPSVLLFASPGYLLNPTGWTEAVEMSAAPYGDSTGPWPPVPAGAFGFHEVAFRFWWSAYICHFTYDLNVTGTESNGNVYGTSFVSGDRPAFRW